MMKNVYLLYSGYFGTTGVVIGAYQKKKDSIAEIKQPGKYEYNVRRVPRRLWIRLLYFVFSITGYNKTMKDNEKDSGKTITSTDTYVM